MGKVYDALRRAEEQRTQRVREAAAAPAAPLAPEVPAATAEVRMKSRRVNCLVESCLLFEGFTTGFLSLRVGGSSTLSNSIGFPEKDKQGLLHTVCVVWVVGRLVGCENSPMACVW